MQILNYIPDGWSPDKLNAFNDVVTASLAYMVFDYALTKAQVSSGPLVQDRTDVLNLIRDILGPRLANTQ